MKARSPRRTRAAAAVLTCALLAGCGGAAAGPGAASPGTDDPTPVAAGTADAVETTPTEEPSETQPDPRELRGPSTAVIADDDVHAIVDDPQPQLPVTVTSYDGVEVTIESVDRIIAVNMTGTLGEIVFTLGLGDNLVGRDMSTDFPAAADVPVVTVGGHNLTAEGILDLDPTVVLTDENIGPAEVHQQLRDAGVPVVFFDPDRSLEGVNPLIEDVALALGVPDVGAELVAQVEDQMASALELAPEGHEPLRIVFLYVRGTAGVYLMAGEGSGADSMIEAVGAIDVGTELGLAESFMPITSEALIAAQPDVIMVMTKGLESVGGVDGLLEIPGVAQTPAGEHRRVVDMADSVILAFGPRIGATIEALAAAIYEPDAA